MALTSLYTLAELEAEIEQAKKDLRTARQAVLRQRDTGSGASQRVQQDTVRNLQTHLEWLQKQRANLQIGAGAQSLVGRPAR